MKFYRKPQSGQSLIETIVALFILVTALVAGLGLALYAVANSVNAKNQIIATNLAREGIDVIRMMRDSNWLAAEDDNQIADLQNCTFPMAAPNNVKPCYPEAFASQGALGDQFDLETRGNHDEYYRINFRGTGDWELDQANFSDTYFLCVQNDGTYQHNGGILGLTPACNDGRFARKVSIYAGSTASPFTTDGSNPTAAAGHSPEKIIVSTVVWQGRGCTAFPTSIVSMLAFDPEAFSTRCKMVITERLTNWKDYQ